MPGDAIGAAGVKRGLLYLLALACILGFVRLGFWQLHRAGYKEALLAHSRQVLDQRHAEPLAVLADATKVVGDGNQYTWTAGSGHFLSMPAVRLDNQDRGGRSGVRIYRAFQPNGAKHAVLVELGWRQLPPNRELSPEPVLAGSWHVQGLFAPPPAAGLQLLFAGDAIQRQPDGSLLLMRLDPARVATTLGLANGLAPRVLRLDPAIALGYARDLDVLGGTMPPERHRGYAVQWFGMAFALFIITIVVSRRKRT